SAVQTSLNTGKAPSLGSMYLDAVHYKYDESATGGNPLHNEAYALNLVNHMLAHMLGYIYESGIHAPVLDTYAASFYPQGLPKDPDRSPTYLTDYSDGPVSLANAASGSAIPVGERAVRGKNITFAFPALASDAHAEVTLYDSSGKRVLRIFSGSMRAGTADLVLDWNGLDESGAAVRAGAYGAVLRLGRQTFSKRVLLLPGNE